MKQEKKSSSAEQPNFEKDLEKLESVVAALEEGGLSLDAALKHFEDGTKLAQRCEQALTEAEKRIEILTKNAQGELETKPFLEEGANPRSAAVETQVEEPDEDSEENGGELLF